MGLELEYLPGQTPLDEDEKDGLLIPTITTRRELDEFEQKNIEEAIQWSPIPLVVLYRIRYVRKSVIFSIKGSIFYGPSIGLLINFLIFNGIK